MWQGWSFSTGSQFDVILRTLKFMWQYQRRLKKFFGVAGRLSLENIPEGMLRSFIFFSTNFFILKTSLEVSPQAEARALHQRVEKLEDR